MRPAVTRADRRATKLIFITRNAIASSYISPPFAMLAGKRVAAFYPRSPGIFADLSHA